MYRQLKVNLDTRHLCLILMLCASLFSFAGNDVINLSTVLDTGNEPEKTGAGVAVSPAHIHFEVTPGDSESRIVTINNDTDRKNSFRVLFNDFNMNGYGKSEFLPAGEGSNSLSRWVNVSPSFVELEPGEKVELTVTATIPEGHADSNKAAWAIMMIEQAEERKTIDPGEANDKIAFGVIPTFAFGVFLYQNPPTVEVNNVDIINMMVNTGDQGNAIQIDVENLGDGISYCTVYVDLTNLQTGETKKLVMKKFTIVPGLKRAFNFQLPEDLSNGQYSAVSVLDFGSDEELEAAEIEFNL
jgi:hypothetical protein